MSADIPTSHDDEPDEAVGLKEINMDSLSLSVISITGDVDLDQALAFLDHAADNASGEFLAIRMRWVRDFVKERVAPIPGNRRT